MNKTKQKTLICIILLTALILCVYEIITTMPKGDGIITKGKMAPEFTAENLKDERVSLKDFRGKGILLNFWGSWCEPCKNEMPRMNEAYHAGIKNVEMIAVNHREGKVIVNRFVNNNNLDFSVISDPYGEIGKQYNIYNLPTTFVIDKDGVIVEHIIGELPTTDYITSLMEMVSAN